MIFFLILSFILIILNILIIGIFLSKISLNIYSLEIDSSNGIEKIQMSINLYIYKVIKVLSIKFYKQYLKIGFIKIYYRKILEYKNKIINSSFTITKLLMGKNILSLKILNPDIESFYMNLILCSQNAALTSITSSLIGSTTSIILSKFVKKYDKDKIYYKIVPTYFSTNKFKLELNTKINLSTFNILIFLYDYYLVKNNN